MSISDLYYQLFGRTGTNKGTDIDMAEHGRAGGVSTGQPFKTTRGVEEKSLIDKVDSNTTYVGTGKMGAVSSDAVWQIIKISVSGTVTTIAYANGDDKYDNVWDDRASISYS